MRVVVDGVTYADPDTETLIRMRDTGAGRDLALVTVNVSKADFDRRPRFRFCGARAPPRGTRAPRGVRVPQTGEKRNPGSSTLPNLEWRNPGSALRSPGSALEEPGFRGAEPGFR